MLLLESANIRLENESLTLCWDRHGNKYEIPIFVINDPKSFTSGKLAPTKIKKVKENTEIKLKIRCFQLSTTDANITINNSKSILDLKKAYVEEQEGAKLERLRVFWNGKELSDASVIAESNMRNNNVVTIMLRKEVS